VTRAKISQYSATANDNTDVNGINIAENCPPSSMNNMGREIMAALKRFQTGSDGDGVTVGGSLVVSGSTTVNTFNVDVISEKTSAAGVTIDGVLLKDNGVVTGAGTVSAPVYSTTGDTNTGIFFPAADTIAFAEGGVEAMRITSDARVGIGTTSPDEKLSVQTNIGLKRASDGATVGSLTGNTSDFTINSGAGLLVLSTSGNERMRIDSSGNVGIGTSSPGYKLHVNGSSQLITGNHGIVGNSDATNYEIKGIGDGDVLGIKWYNGIRFLTIGATERARITSGGNLLVGKTTDDDGTAGFRYDSFSKYLSLVRDSQAPLYINRLTNDGNLIELAQGNTVEGTISVSGSTVSYNAFCGGHWTQLQEGRGYNPDIPRGTVMSSIGEMAVWKSVEWTETTEHPAIEAVEAVEAVLDEDGNVIEPAVEAVEGKEAWTETFNKREAYLGSLDIGAIFEEDGFTKTVVDDGNERLPKVKISDVVGDKAVYGVFQTWDEVEDMLISSLGAFVVRIAAGVTVEIGDLLESNGDGCAKVQDDDIIRSKTIGKVTSTVATDTYDDGSYTVPCVLYCG
jgi:hypothetical protein